MTILGLAGHVDHGKTALVKALTGIDTDRLPEEKARGMTTDLGFAALRLFAPASGQSITAAGSEGSPSEPAARQNPIQEGFPLDIGVIDVPGHERYIRNMVAGAWSLDLALLVVAADDGWMEQSENHARVLSAAGISRVILVIAKIDKVSSDRIAAVKTDALSRARAIFGNHARLAAVEVSALLGQGIDELKNSIALEAKRVEIGRSGVTASRTGFLFIDRVFSKPGTGRIACGTLVGGKLALDDQIIQSPGKTPLRIKGIESLGKAVSSISGSARVALNLSKAKNELRRGDLLYTTLSLEEQGKTPVLFSEREFLLKVESLPYSDASGTSTAEVLKKGGEIEVAVGTAWRMGRITPLGKNPWYRFSCTDELAFPAFSPLVLIRHGGAEILGRAWAVYQGKTDRIQRRKIVDILKSRDSVDLSEISSIIRITLFPKPKNETERKSSEVVSVKTPLSHNLEPLEPALLKAEKLLQTAGKHCIEYPSNASLAFTMPPRKDMDYLCAKGIAIPLDRHLFIHREIYLELIAATLYLKRPGESLEISEAKERTGFSRKFVLPFLNRMERDGYIKRDGERRVILTLP